MKTNTNNGGDSIKTASNETPITTYLDTSYIFPSGTESEPSVRIGDTATGLYNTGTGVGISSSGTSYFSVSPTSIILDSDVTISGTCSINSQTIADGGTVAAPGIVIATSGNGLYSPAANQVGIACAGSAALIASTSALTTSLPISLGAGSAAAPSLQLNGNSGLYSGGAGTVAFSTGGSLAARFASTDFTSNVVLLAPAGSVGAPGYGISGDATTGVYGIGAGNVGVTCSGTKQLDINSTRTLCTGAIQTSDTTDSSSTTTGSGQFAGGIGVAKSMYIGGKTICTDTTDSSSTSTGSGQFAGGVGVAKTVYIGGKTICTDTTDSSSTSTGSGQFAGGVGVAKTVYVGGKTICTDTTESTSTSTGSGQFAGGIGLAKRLNAGGAIQTSDTTETTSTTTGSGIFAGGVGIAKNLHVGGMFELTTTTTQPIFFVASSTTQNLTTGVTSLINTAWGSPSINQGFSSWLVSVLAIATTGYYQISYQVAFEAHTTGDRIAFVEVNSTRYIQNSVKAATSSNTHSIAASAMLKLTAGDTIQLKANQNSGSTLTTGSISANYTNYLALYKVY